MPVAGPAETVGRSAITAGFAAARVIRIGQVVGCTAAAGGLRQRKVLGPVSALGPSRCPCTMRVPSAASGQADRPGVQG